MVRQGTLNPSFEGSNPSIPAKKTMDRLNGSPLKRLELLKGKEWYHQRFDGSPMFIFTIADAEMLKEKRKPTGTYPKVRVCFFSEGKSDWHLDMDDVRAASKKLVAMAKQDPKLSTKLLKAWRRDEKEFDKFFWKTFPKMNLSTMSDKQLLVAWKQYYKLAIRRLSSTGIIDHFSLGTDSLINEMVKEELRALSKGKQWKDSEFSGIFAIATAPVHQSFINQAEIDLLKIATKQSKETIDEYQKRYFWTKNNYVSSNILSVKHFQQDIQAWKKSKKDLKKEIDNLQNTPKRNLGAKKQLLKLYKFSALLKTLLKMSEDFTMWQDDRKRATYFHIYMGSAFLQEIGKRKGYTLDQLKYTTGFELESLFTNGNPSPKELDNRKSGSVFVATPKGFYVGTGPDVEKTRQVMWGEKVEQDIKDFRGLTASLGKVMGRVRIIKSVDEIGKIIKGEILVAVMTRPDYVPAMKKAAAIVTNEGGVTSHAAIVSRELGIPCIIGTKIATEVLHDGDLIEVNANHGKVSILEKAK